MSLQDFIIAGKFKVGRKFGGGSFGDVHVGINLQTNQEVAIKMESQKAKSPQLMYEAKVYKTIGAAPGLPIVHWYGAEGDYNVMVVDLLGPSLTDMFKFCDSKFSLKTVLMLADQMITRVEQVHSRNYLHRDIKPQNFTMGLGKAANLVHIIDFGLAKKYRDPESADHIPKKNNCQLVGTARYSSLNTHLGIEQSRRDDLEAVGHVLFYFLRGNLPWQGYHDENIEKKYQKITEKKMAISVEQLGRHYPPEFVTFVNYCRSLEFEDQPDYSFPRMLFYELAWKENNDYDQVFDWYTISEEKRIDAEVRFGRKLEAESPDDFARKLRIEAEEKIERKEFVIDED